MVLAGDFFHPGVHRELLHTQGNALLLLVHGEHHTLDLVALLDHLGGVRDLLGPAHVRDVQQAVDAFFDLDESAIRSQIANRALDHRAHRVVIVDNFPGVRLGLLHAEGYLLFAIVDVEHHNLHLFATLDEFGGMADAAGPGHLGDVHQTLDAVLELDEGTIGHDVDHLALDLLTHGVACLDAVPRRGLLLLDAQGDAVLVAVDLQHDHFQFLVELYHLGGVADAAPGHIGDVQQAVDAAEVHEDTKVCDVLDDTRADLTDFDIAEEGFLQQLAFLFEELAPRDHDVLALGVDLDDARPNGLVDKGRDVVGAAQVDLAGGQEDIDAIHIDQQAALDLAQDHALDEIALDIFLGDAIPGALPVGPLLGEVGRVLVAVLAFVEDFELLALLRQLVAKLSQRHLSFGLAADVHHDHLGLVIHRVDHGDDDGAWLDVLDRIVKGNFKGVLGEVAGGGSEPFVEFLGIEVIALQALGG